MNDQHAIGIAANLTALNTLVVFIAVDYVRRNGTDAIFDAMAEAKPAAIAAMVQKGYSPEATEQTFDGVFSGIQEAIKAISDTG